MARAVVARPPPLRIALITTPLGAAEDPSGTAARTRALLPHLRQHAEVELYVEAGRAGRGAGGEPARSLAELRPRDHDHILYQLADERRHGFMLPAIRALGGTVALHGWELGLAARAAFPALERGGWRALFRALSEGGLREARAWTRSRRAAAPASSGSLCLNRSAVRFGDSFLVPTEELRQRILRDRGAPTPIALVPAFAPALAAPGPSAEPAPAWDRVALACIEALERFPHPRSARRSLVALAFRARAAAREARRTALQAGPHPTDPAGAHPRQAGAGPQRVGVGQGSGKFP